MTKVVQFRDQSNDELVALLADKRKNLFDLYNKRSREKKIDKPHLFKSTKKEIAQILTVLTEKSVEEKGL